MRTFLDESDTEEERESRSSSQGPDREITLGTTMILLIFFALAVYGAVLFGFGYSLGSKHNGPTVSAAAVTPASPGSFNTSKPAAGSPVGSASAEKPPPATAQAQPVTVPLPQPAPAKPDTPEPKLVASTSDFEEAASKAKTPPPPAPVATPPPATIPVVATGTIVVQVAAVSHQEDAELIATTLKHRGYVVNVKTEADKLFHVQVGPFGTRKDAEAMKTKLLSDGFNAYIK